MGWSEYFRNCWSSGIFTISRVYRKWSGKKKKKSSERQFCGRKCLVDARGQRRMATLVQTDRKATVRYDQDLQKSISQSTTRRTLKQLSYSSRRYTGATPVR